MKLTALLLTAAVLQVSAHAISQSVSYSGKNVALEKVLSVVEKQTGYVFLYSQTVLQQSRPVTIGASNLSLTAFLELLFKEQPIRYVVRSKSIFLSLKEGPPVVLADSSAAIMPDVIPDWSPIPVGGKVVDAEGNPLAGATIANRRTKQIAMSGADGSFTLEAEKGDILIITYVGYAETSVRVSGRNSPGLLIKLSPADNNLSEVVVSKGYYTEKKRLTTGSVSRVSSEVINVQPITNVLAALEGRVPGMVITQSSGMAGAAFKVQIRGQNSLVNGSEPLYIVDGVPFAPGNEAVNNFTAPIEISPFNSINPQDIQSVDILRDADATAIYGSRGANGVIIITTKKGEAGKTQFSANVRTGISKVSSMLDMLNTQQYLAVRREAFANDGIVPNAVAGSAGYAPDLKIWDTTRYTDWQKLLIGGTSHYTDANASLSGGNANTRFLVGTGYHYETSVLPGNMSDGRASFNSNISHTSNDKRVTAAFYTNFSRDVNRLFAGNLEGIALSPNAPAPYAADGQLNWQEGGANYANPLATFLNTSKVTTENLLVSLQLSYRVWNKLVLRTNLGYNSMHADELQLLPTTAQDPTTVNPVGSSNFGNSKFSSFIIEPQAEYSMQLAGGTLSALAGGSWQYKNTYRSIIYATGYSSDALLQALDAAPTISYKGNSNVDYKYAAFFARIGYNWKDRYLLNLSGRRDGSSRFGPDQLYNSFGSAGTAWVFSNESFIQQALPFLSFGKLRGSYGVTGNDQIGDYKYLNTWSAIGLNPYQGGTALQADALFNPDYSWERNKKLEAALDLGFFRDRVQISAAYFSNRCNNQLVDYALPAQTGFLSITKNLDALISNKGWELEVSADAMRTEKFRWNIAFNITLPSNRLLEFPNLSTSSYNAVYIIGKSVNLINRYKYTGVNPTTGLLSFQDVNGDGALSTKDYQYLGFLDPQYYGGVSNTLSWKGITLTAFVEFKKQTGYSPMGAFYSVSYQPGLLNNVPVAALDRWQKAGDLSVNQRYTANTSSSAYQAGTNYFSSDAYYANTSYLRLKNVALSFNLPAATVARWRLTDCRFFLQGQNLLTFTGFTGNDPETQLFYVLPPLRTITAGLQITL